MKLSLRLQYAARFSSQLGSSMLDIYTIIRYSAAADARVIRRCDLYSQNTCKFDLLSLRSKVLPIIPLICSIELTFVDIIHKELLNNDLYTTLTSKSQLWYDFSPLVVKCVSRPVLKSTIKHNSSENSVYHNYVTCLGHQYVTKV